jgi:hypothetical protein
LIDDVIQTLPRDFTLDDVRRYESRLASEYPQNRNIDAKIRQTLQILRDQGVLKFLGGGRYRRLQSTPVISLQFDPNLASGYASKPQMARVTIETWAEMNLYCLSCSSDRLRRLPANTPLSDFSCPGCNREYQLKAKDGRFAGIIPGADYKIMLAAVRAGSVPAYILAEYDTRYSKLVWVRALPGTRIHEERVVARNPLKPTARRRGWVGCNINVAGIPTVDIVAPRAEDRALARSLWTDIKR